MAADTVALMDRLGIERAHYVGHSTGGAMGQTIAQDHPARLLSLVLSATWPGQDAYFRRCFETRKELLLNRGFESYWRASVVMLRPPRWISENDAALVEEMKRLAAAPPPAEILASRIDAIVRFDPVSEKFETFTSNRDQANVRQMLGRSGEAWGAESGVDRLVMVPAR